MDINKKLDEANLSEAQKKLMLEIFNSLRSNPQDSSGTAPENLGQSVGEPAEASTSCKSTKKQKTLYKFFAKDESQRPSISKEKLKHKTQESVTTDDKHKLCHTASNVSASCKSELTTQNKSLSTTSPSKKTSHISPNNKEQVRTNAKGKGTLSDEDLIKKMSEKEPLVVLDKLDVRDYGYEVKPPKPVFKQKTKKPGSSPKISSIGKKKNALAKKCLTDEGSSQDKQFSPGLEQSNFSENLTGCKGSKTTLDSVLVSDAKPSEQSAKTVLVCVEKSAEVNKRKLRVRSSSSRSCEELVTVDGTDKNRANDIKSRDDKASTNKDNPLNNKDNPSVSKLTDSISPVRRNSRNQRAKIELVYVEKGTDDIDAHSENLVDTLVTVNKTDNLNNKEVINDKGLSPDEPLVLELSDVELASPKRNLRSKGLKKSPTCAQILKMSKDEVSVYLNQNLNEKNCLADKIVVDVKGSSLSEQLVSESIKSTSPLTRELRNQGATKESACVENILEMSKGESSVLTKKKLKIARAVIVKELNRHSSTKLNAMDDGSKQDKHLVLDDSIASSKRKFKKPSAKKESTYIKNIPELSRDEASVLSENNLETSKDESSVLSNKKLNNEEKITVKELDKNKSTEPNARDVEGSTKDKPIVLDDVIVSPKRKLKKPNAKKESTCVDNIPEMTKDESSVLSNKKPHKTTIVMELDKNNLTKPNARDVEGSTKDKPIVSDDLIASPKRKLKRQNAKKESTCVDNIPEMSKDESSVLSNKKLNRATIGKELDRNNLTEHSAINVVQSTKDKPIVSGDLVASFKRKLKQQNAKKESTCVDNIPEMSKDEYSVLSNKKLNKATIGKELDSSNSTKPSAINVEESTKNKPLVSDASPKRKLKKQSAKKESTCVEIIPEMSKDESSVHSNKTLDKTKIGKKLDRNNLTKPNAKNVEVLTKDKPLVLDDSIASPKRKLKKQNAKEEPTCIESIPEMSNEESNVLSNKELNNEKKITVKELDKNNATKSKDRDVEGSSKDKPVVSDDLIASPKGKLKQQNAKKESTCVDNIPEMSKDESSVLSKSIHETSKEESNGLSKTEIVKDLDKNSSTKPNAKEYEESTKDKPLVLDESISSSKRKLRNPSSNKESTCADKTSKMTTAEVGASSNEKLNDNKPVAVKGNIKNATEDKEPKENEQFVSESTALTPVLKRKQRKRSSLNDLTCNEKNTEIINSEVCKKPDVSPKKVKLADGSDANCVTGENIKNSCHEEQLLLNLRTDLELKNQPEVSEAVKTLESNLVSVSTPNRRQSKRNIKSTNELISVEETSDFNEHTEQHSESSMQEKSFVNEVATVDKNVDLVNKNTIEINKAEASDFPPNTKQSLIAKKRQGKTLNKRQNASAEKEVSTKLSTEMQNSGTIGDDSETICKSGALMWSSCIINEQGLEYPKSNQQISDINPMSVKMKLTQLPQNMNSQSETTGKTKKRKISNESNPAPKRTKKSPRNTKLTPESSKRTGTNALESTEMEIAPSELVRNEKASIAVLPLQVKDPSIQPSEANKLNFEDGQTAAALVLLPETTGDEKEYEAFCSMQNIFSSIGISLENVFRNRKAAKELKTKQMKGADALFFLQAHNLVNGNVVPSFHVHNSKKKLEETLHQLA